MSSKRLPLSANKRKEALDLTHNNSKHKLTLSHKKASTPRLNPRTPQNLHGSKSNVSVMSEHGHNTTVLTDVVVKSKETEQMMADLEYYKYLRACFQNALMEKKEVELRSKGEDKLEVLRNKLRTAKEREEELRFKAEKLKLELKLKESMERLESVVNKSKILDNNFHENIIKMTDLMDVLKSRLYLENIDNDKSNEECAKIKVSLERINNSIREYKETTGDFEIVAKLGENFKILKEIKAKQERVKKLEVNLEHFVLQKLSCLLSNSK